MQCTGLTLQQIDEIDWDNLGKALAAQKLNTQMQIIKFMHNWLNTGTQKQKFYKDAIMSCPVFCLETEKWQHMFNCKHEGSTTLCTLALTKFNSALIKMNTAPILCQVLFYKVSQWCKLPCGTPPHLPTDSTGNIVRDTVERQGQLSWDNFMKGRIAFEQCWSQAQYYLSLIHI
eukprot:13466444-Ditylum_brightwellii.AAC.1